MVGRLALDNPIELLTIDPLLGRFNPLTKIKCPTLLRQEIMMIYADYLERLACGEVRDEEERQIESVSQVMLLQPILNLYRGQLNGGKFRNRLSELTLRKDHQPSYKIVRELAQWITQSTYEVQREISSSKGKQGREAPAE